VNSASALPDTLDRLIADVYTGRLHPRIAAGLAPLMSLQLRAIKATELELRVAKLEKLLEESEESSKHETRAPGPEKST
jgi:hypothetical protein